MHTTNKPSPKPFLPLSVPNLQGKELEYVSHAVETSWVSTVGAYVTRFEEDIAHYVGTKGAVACQSGTAGLHLALILCGVGAGDLVFAPALTFIAAVNPITYVGAEPIFLDCDHSLCIDPVKLRHYCQTKCELRQGVLWEKERNQRISALVVVHIFGNMANMVDILQIAQEFHLKIVEDATEALGTYYTKGPLQGKFAGTMGDVGVYSFNGNKIITTGGGGMLVSNDTTLLERGKHLSTQAKSDPLYYTHDEIGFNYRMTNVQAALGVAQLEQLEGFISTKRNNFLRYQQGLAKFSTTEEGKNCKLVEFREDIRSNYWFYSLDCFHAPLSRDALIQALEHENIQTRPIWGLISQQKPYLNAISDSTETAEHYYQNIVNLPCSSNLERGDVDRVLEVLRTNI